MGISLAFWEETPERVEYYLENKKWPSRVGLGLRFYDMGKNWSIWHNLFCSPEKPYYYFYPSSFSFPENFILSGKRLPNYEDDEMDDDDECDDESRAPFLRTVEETKAISEFLDSFDRDTLQKRCTREFWVMNGFSGDYTSEEEEDWFHSFYYSFEKLQRFFRRIAADEHCVISRRS